jgi:KaiC/GvpD/RAD55 family RecA-like ATPase
MKIERVETGINGLDELIQGGFPKGYCVLLSGAPGTGKTIFALQYIYYGAQRGEKGLYVTFNEEVEDVLIQPGVFGWEAQKYIDSGKMKVLCIDTKDFDVNDLVAEIKQGNYERFVLDSLSSLLAQPIAIEDIDISYTLKDRLERLAPSPLNIEVATRLLVEKIIREVRRVKCTSVIISELVESIGGLSRDTISEFLVDGVITLQYVMVGIESASSRNLMVRKMRATAHSENIHPIEFKEGTGMHILIP